MRKHAFFIAAILYVVITPGCSPEELGVLTSGSEVVFGASTLWQNGPATRTEYSGKDQNNASINATDSEYERINWVKNTDHIRIYSPEAAKLDGTTHVQDYYISSDPVFPASPDAKKSQANIACTDANGLQWAAGSGSQHFFALYPAPGTKWKYDQTKVVPTPPQSPQASDVYAKIEPGTDNAHAVVTAVVPSVQEVFWNASENEYEPNMNYAYMYAATTGTRGNGVLLSFKPLVTAIRFTLKMKDGELKLKTFKLKSSTVDLSGTFTATVSTSGNPTFGTPTGTTKDISLSIPATQQQTLTTSGTVTVTVLTLPVDLTDLSIEMSFLNSSNAEVIRTLDLKTRASASDPYTPIQVDACHKSYINDLGIPGTFEYELSVTGPSAIAQAGGDSNVQTFTVTSYKNVGGASLGVGWTAEFSTDNGKTWSPNKPDWLTTFTNADADGSTSPESFNVKASTNNTTRTWKGDTTVGSNNSKANAWNLACYDIKGNYIFPGQGYDRAYQPANCYVISRPGWYKIPCVYGSCYRNGFEKSVTYSGFVNDNDANITTAWLVNAGRTVTKGALFWEEVNGLITNIDWNDHFIRFYVEPSKIQQGNAIIAAQNNDGTTLWSWHLWFIEPGRMTTTVIENAAGKRIEIMDLNLGWVDAAQNAPRDVLVRITQAHSGKKALFMVSQNGDSGRRQGRNVNYQWGRKDPMVSNTDNSFTTQVGIHGTFGTGSGTYTANATSPTIGNSIRNPHRFMIGYYWSRPANTKLWNVDAVFNSSSDIEVKKTIYDPCPYGYKVPSKDTFTRFSSNNNNVVGAWNYGFYFTATSSGDQTVFFPATSYRLTNGNLSDSDSGAYWTAAQTNHSDGNGMVSPYYFQVAPDWRNPLWHAGPIGFGFNVRCVKDNVTL